MDYIRAGLKKKGGGKLKKATKKMGLASGTRFMD